MRKKFKVYPRDKRFPYQLTYAFTCKGELHSVTDQLRSYGDQEGIDYCIQEDLDTEDKKIYSVFVP